jgi:5-methyltetrahydrofolate--homocysteine methyltransferase
MADIYEDLSKSLITGNLTGIKRLTQQALDQGLKAKDVLDKGLLPGMDVVGQRFKTGEMFMPEVIYSAKTMHAAMEVLKPLLMGDDVEGTGVLVIGTVEGDLHDIGKNLVAMMMEGAGFTVIDLGTNVKSQTFVDAVKQHKPNLVGLSALLTTTMPKMKETIDSLKEAGLRDRVKVIIGGAPVTAEFMSRIGADGYGINAGAAVENAKTLVGK